MAFTVVGQGAIYCSSLGHPRQAPNVSAAGVHRQLKTCTLRKLNKLFSKFLQLSICREDSFVRFRKISLLSPNIVEMLQSLGLFQSFPQFDIQRVQLICVDLHLRGCSPFSGNLPRLFTLYSFILRLKCCCIVMWQTDGIQCVRNVFLAG